MHFAGVPSLGDVVDVELYIISAWILLFNLYVQLFFFLVVFFWFFFHVFSFLMRCLTLVSRSAVIV
jgi:hypothetical protein